MMDDLLKELQDYLYTALVQGSTQYLKTVLVMDMFSQAAAQKIYHFPACIINPINEDHRPGPFAQTARQHYGVRLRLIAKSVDPNAYRVNPSTGSTTHKNLNDVSEQIRLVLYGNKLLTSNTFEMNDTFQVAHFNQVANAEGHFDVLDILVEYTKLELYTGMANDQASLNPAYQF